eukprot:12752471-Prorocentrum_lima.AAC.1
MAATHVSTATQSTACSTFATFYLAKEDEGPEALHAALAAKAIDWDGQKCLWGSFASFRCIAAAAQIAPIKHLSVPLRCAVWGGADSPPSGILHV